MEEEQVSDSDNISGAIENLQAECENMENDLDDTGLNQPVADASSNAQPKDMPNRFMKNEDEVKIIKEKMLEELKDVEPTVLKGMFDILLSNQPGLKEKVYKFSDFAASTFLEVMMKAESETPNNSEIYFAFKKMYLKIQKLIKERKEADDKIRELTEKLSKQELPSEKQLPNSIIQNVTKKIQNMEEDKLAEIYASEKIKEYENICEEYETKVANLINDKEKLNLQLREMQEANEVLNNRLHECGEILKRWESRSKNVISQGPQASQSTSQDTGIQTESLTSFLGTQPKHHGLFQPTSYSSCATEERGNSTTRLLPQQTPSDTDPDPDTPVILSVRGAHGNVRYP